MKTLREKIKAGQQLRIAAIQFEQTREDTFSVTDTLTEAKFDTEQLLHPMATAVFASYEKDKHEEDLRKYIAAANGRSIILYANVHCLAGDVMAKNPSWACRTEAGEDYVIYSTYKRQCINSPWRDSFLHDVSDMTAQNIQGIFLDGPSMPQQGCFCESCRALFEKTYGHPIGDATPAEMNEFKIKSNQRFLKDVGDAIRASGKDILLYNNCALPDSIVDCSLDDVYDYVDILGTEGGFNFYVNPNNISLWKGSRCAKYLEAKAYGKPTVLFCAGNHQPWARAMHTAAENELLYAYTIANGASIWYGIHGPIEQYNTPGGKAALKWNRFMAENEEWYTATKRVATSALVWSKPTYRHFPEAVAKTDFTSDVDGGGNTTYGSFQKEFYGLYDIMSRAHSQFTMIDEINLEKDDLSSYTQLVLPNLICLSDAHANILRNFVAQGGNLIFTGATGICDENGKVRDIPVLADLVGMKGKPEIKNFQDGCGYLTLHDKSFGADCNHDLLEGFIGTVLKAEYDADIIASINEPMAGRYSYYNEDLFPAIVTKTYGKGRVVYFAGNIGYSWNDFGPADLKHLFSNIAIAHDADAVTVEGAYESVEVLLREKGDAKLLHLVNYTGAMQRPIENIIPNTGIKVKVKKDKATSVKTLVGGRELPFVVSDGYVTFTADVSGAYEVVVIE
ncbi:MAG: beta-galactosidase trimerization domain-containing protein [Oscillospiraceae bacterium]|nr:beta-galactosidase trimerization domain-containing protein [Oscillospiraceae bacterium]